MNEGIGPTGSAYQAPHKEYVVSPSKPRAFMVEDAQWNRIHDRIDALEAKSGIDWLLALATMMGGVAASGGLALLVLPSATNEETKLSPAVEPALWAVLIGGTVVAVAMGLLWRHLRSSQEKAASDICNEMDTIQAAWQEREVEGSPG